MRALDKFLLVLIAVCAALYIFAPDLFPYPARAILKMTPAWMLAVLAWRAAPKNIRRPLTLALVFCGIGDFILSAPFALSFVMGMGAFLLAQLGFLWVFSKTIRPWAMLDTSRRIIILILGVYALGMSFLILPRTGALMPAIGVYFAVLSLMAASSFASLAPRWTRLGALFFVLSDTLIGIDLFLIPLEFRHLAVMSTYYAAIFLIVSGLCWQGRTR